jgi:hypothetical protein
MAGVRTTAYGLGGHTFEATLIESGNLAEGDARIVRDQDRGQLAGHTPGPLDRNAVSVLNDDRMGRLTAR